MARHTKKEFAAQCGIKTKDLSVYISRGKVNVKGDLIDDSDQMNHVFRERMASKKGVAASPEAKPVKSAKPEPTAEELAEKSSLTSILKEKNTLEVQQRKNILQLQAIDIAKKRGELVPTQSVKDLILQHSESIKTAYTEASDNLIVIISQQQQMSADAVAHVRREFLKIVNKAVDSAINATQKNLLSVVREYSAKRGVGDHD